MYAAVSAAFPSSGTQCTLSGHTEQEVRLGREGGRQIVSPTQPAPVLQLQLPQLSGDTGSGSLGLPYPLSWLWGDDHKQTDLAPGLRTKEPHQPVFLLERNKTVSSSRVVRGGGNAGSYQASSLQEGLGISRTEA